MRGTHLKECFFPFLILILAQMGCAPEQFITSRDGVLLAYEYKQVQPEKGTAVLLHGLGSNRDEFYTLRVFLNKNGWSTLAFDFRGHGSSRTWLGKEIDWKNFSHEDFSTLSRDVEAAVERLEGRKNIWLIGSSIGANLALHYAAQHPGVRGIVLLTPGYNYAGIDSLPSMEQYERRPVLIAASEDDPLAVDFCRALYEKAKGPKKFLPYKTAGHGAQMIENEKGLKVEIRDWLNRNSIYHQ